MIKFVVYITMKTKNNFKKYREQLNLTQKDISKLLNINNNSVVSKIENGHLFGQYYVQYLKILYQKGVDLNKFFMDDE